MLRNRLWTGVVVIGVALLFSIQSTPLQAQSPAPTGVNLTTSPLPINLSARPGQTVSTNLRVQNNASQTQNIKVSLMKFKAYGESGKPALQEREDGDDYFDWVTFTPPAFNAPPGQWMNIKMSIAVPTTAAFGYYYAAVFTPDDQKPTGKGNAYLGSAATLVLLDVKSPNAKRSLEVTEFSAQRKMYEFLPVVFSVRVHNSGNTHAQPHGNIFIKRGSKQVASLVVNPAQGNVLPGSNRVFTVPWTDGFPLYVDKTENGRTVLDSQGNVVKELKWDFTKVPKLKFGHYTANLLLVYDNGQADVPLEATLSFWVIPWRVIGVLVVVGVLAGIGLWSVGKKLYLRIRKLRKHDKKSS